MEAKKRTRRHLSAQVWAEVIARFDSSGESVTGFCKREGLHTSSFRRWRQRLATNAATPNAVPEHCEPRRPSAAASFIEMGAMCTASEPTGRLEVRLELGLAWCCMWCAADVLPRRPDPGVPVRGAGGHEELVRRAVRAGAPRPAARPAEWAVVRLHQPPRESRDIVHLFVRSQEG